MQILVCEQDVLGLDIAVHNVALMLLMSARSYHPLK